LGANWHRAWRKWQREEAIKLGSYEDENKKACAERGAFGCLRSASLEVRGWR